jgi:hypothetical protein
MQADILLTGAPESRSTRVELTMVGGHITFEELHR